LTVAQSTWIALSLVALFLVYITARGELGQYLATILGPYPQPEAGGAGVERGIDGEDQHGGLVTLFTAKGARFSPSWLGIAV
jgi:hypothetical protein